MHERISLIAHELAQGTLIPYLSLGVFEHLRYPSGEMVPYDDTSLILTMNQQRPMPPRLMSEYSRAAMHLEQRRGYDYIQQLIAHIYTQPFDPSMSHTLVAPSRYIIDTNRDTKLQEILSATPHQMIVGCARILGDASRYHVYEYDVVHHKYFEIEEEALSLQLPLLFKPMGSLIPKPSFVISDADYVDWITEAMGGFALPAQLKSYRKGKKYLFLGCRFDHDTERMVANELTLDLCGGYVITPHPITKKEQKFFDKHQLEVIALPLDHFLDQLKGM